ncbi:MAG TPA: hypothetical protein VL972_02305 [Solirubrobacteraceae bacterium]|nr:hypothetical protein [Solirubrobacteraceae bacterium]
MAAATIDELLIADEPERWSALGFAVREDTCMLGAVRVRFAGVGRARGVVDWSLREIAGTDLDGLPTRRSRRPPPETAGAPRHANGIVGIDHIVAMSPALDRTVAALRRAGLDLRRVREEPTPAGAPRQAFFRLGVEILEVIQIPEEAIGRAGGVDGPARFWGLAAVTEDLERTVAHMEGKTSPIREAVQPGRRIATLRQEAGLSVALAIMSPPPPPGERS